MFCHRTKQRPQAKAMTGTSFLGDENLLCRGVQLHPDRQSVPCHDGFSFQGDPHLHALNWLSQNQVHKCRPDNVSISCLSDRTDIMHWQLAHGVDVAQLPSGQKKGIWLFEKATALLLEQRL